MPLPTATPDIVKAVTLMLAALTSLSLASCTASRTASSAPPAIEVSQVPDHGEIVVRLRDESASGRSLTASIYTNRSSMRLAQISLARETYGQPWFIGVYSNDKELPQGTEVTVEYRTSRQSEPVHAKTTMLYQ